MNAKRRCRLCHRSLGRVGGSSYPGVCRGCADRANVEETISRITRWTEIRGRRRVAEVLVLHADLAVQGRPREDAMRVRHRNWIALFEFANDGKALRRVVERRLVRRGHDAIPVPDPDVPVPR